jgi:hypothetical protein
LICWAEVGPWFLRQFRAAAASEASVPLRTGQTEEAPTAAGADHEQAQAAGQPTEPMGRRRPTRTGGGVAPGRAAAAQSAAGEQALLERARTLNAAHRQAHGRQISRDKLRAALGIGATRAERLLAALAAEPSTSGPPVNGPELAPPAAVLPARPGQWTTLPMPLGAARQGDGDHG